MPETNLQHLNASDADYQTCQNALESEKKTSKSFAEACADKYPDSFSVDIEYGRGVEPVRSKAYRVDTAWPKWIRDFFS